MTDEILEILKTKVPNDFDHFAAALFLFVRAGGSAKMIDGKMLIESKEIA